MPGKSDSVHFLRLPEYDETRLNHAAVEAMEALQAVVEQGRNAREKRNISLRTPVKQVVVIIRNPSKNVIDGISGPLAKYILSELNAWEFTVVPREDQHDWVTLSLAPEFKVLGKKLGSKMKAVQAAVKALSHDEAVKVLEDGKITIEDVELDAATELVSKLAFSKEGDHWEATESSDGACVIALDCTQDQAIISSGMSRELVNHVQQLRKGAGLDLSDLVEVFFQEEEGITSTEDAVAMNVEMLEAKLRGSIPLPERLAPSWIVPLKSDIVDVGGSKVKVSVCRPSVAVRDDLDQAVKNIFATKEPSEFSVGEVFMVLVDGKYYELKEGEDFWLSTCSKVKATKALAWF
jgi:isoleucyl-tRNA synthetase